MSKGQNIVYKKLCPQHLISKESYIIWLSFVVYKCKLMISPGYFFSKFWCYLQAFFSKFWQKMVQNQKRFCLLNAMSLEPYIIWLSFVVDICKMIISPGFFFHFLKILIFWFASGIKGQKMTQNDKSFCLLHLISQESLFIVHMRKRKYLFIFFPIFNFWGQYWGKRAKNDPK